MIVRFAPGGVFAAWFFAQCWGVGCSCLRCRCASVNFFFSEDECQLFGRSRGECYLCDGPALVLFVTHAGPRRPPRKAV